MASNPASTLQSLCAIILNSCSHDLDSLQFVARSLWLMGRDRAANRDELEEQREDILSETHARGPRLAARTARAAPA
eukprot:13327072-Heterocapsa_arctica.AAC.1